MTRTPTARFRPRHACGALLLSVSSLLAQGGGLVGDAPAGPVPNPVLPGPQPDAGTDPLWLTVMLMGAVAVILVVTYVMKRWYDHMRDPDVPTASTMMEQFRQMRAAGTLSDEEFEKVKNKLGRKVQQEQGLEPTDRTADRTRPEVDEDLAEQVEPAVGARSENAGLDEVPAVEREAAEEGRSGEGPNRTPGAETETVLGEDRRPGDDA